MPPFDGQHDFISAHIDNVEAEFLRNRATQPPKLHEDTDVVFLNNMLSAHERRRAQIIQRAKLTDADLKHGAYIFSLHTKKFDAERALLAQHQKMMHTRKNHQTVHPDEYLKLHDLEEAHEAARWAFEAQPFHDELLQIYECDYYKKLFTEKLGHAHERARVRAALR